MNSSDKILSFCANTSRLIQRMLIACIVFNWLFSSTVLTADSTGQKAHFQVEDKSGDLKISATKDLAKVTAQADSVQVVVKPGTAEYPVLKSDKPIVHITQPGWHTMSFRKSAIFKTKMPRQARKYEADRTRRTSKERIIHSSKGVHQRLKLGLKRRNGLLKKSSFSPARLTPKKESLSYGNQDVLASKKSDVKYSGFHVTGNAGKLKMHVTKDETTLSSESGGVDVTLNKPPSSSSSSTPSQRQLQAPSQRVEKESGDKMIHLAPELASNMSFNGLRKSVVTKLVHDIKTDWD